MAASPELVLVVGRLRGDDYQGAVGPSERLLAQFPDESDAHALHAFTRYALWMIHPTAENMGAAESSITALDKVDPGNPYGELIRAMLVREHDNEPQKAIGLYGQILTREDLSALFRAWVLRARAQALTTTGEYMEAQADAEEALRLDPLHGSNYSTLFGILANSGRLEEAAGRAEQAVALAPQDLSFRYQLGWIRYRLGDADASVAVLQEACEMHRFQRGCALLAAALQRTGREDEALEVAWDAEGLPETGRGHIGLARFWLLKGERDQALHHLDRAVDLGLFLPILNIDTLLLEDPDFAPLRGDPRFEKIAQELKRQIGQE